MKLLLPPSHPAGWIRQLLGGNKVTTNTLSSVIIMRTLFLAALTFSLLVLENAFDDTSSFHTLGEPIGQGGFGTVYKAEYHGQIVAVKVPNGEHKENKENTATS
jgi:serine/threonine protein kinase